MPPLDVPVTAAPVRALMVDDDRHDFFITRELLRRAERGTYELDWVDTFEAGRDAMARQSHDVFLVDYNLGPRTGLELLAEARALGCERPIIIVTGSRDERLDERAMRSGAADFLSKDQLSRTILERTIRHALDRASALQAAREVEARLTATLSCLPVVLFALDPEGRVRWADGAGLDALGVAPMRLIGRNGARFLRRRCQPSVDVRALAFGESRQTAFAAGGRSFRCRLSTIGPDGTSRGVLGVAVDAAHPIPLAPPGQLAQTT